MNAGGDGGLSPAEVDRLYGMHAASLRAFANGLLRQRELADEVVQATFAKAIEAGAEVHPQAWRAWLFRVAYNEAMLVRRRQGFDLRSLAVLAANRPRTGASAVDEIGRREDVARVRTAIAGLPEEQRIVVWLRVYEEQTFAEIARRQSIPLGTVLTRMRLALKKLELALKADE